MYLGTFRANQIDITFKNLNNLDIQSNMPVYLEIGLNTNYKAIQSKYKYEQDGLKYFEVLNSEEMSYLDLNHYVNISVNGVMYERLLIQNNIFPDENVIYFGIDLWQIPSINTSDEIIIYPYEYIPKGYYLIEEPDENYHKTCKITCLDYSVKMKTNCDYSSALDENGEITLEQLLQWLCINYSVKLGTYPNVNRDMKISVYDSTLSGKAYVSYIAEMMGGNAKFNRNNELCIIPLKQDDNYYISGELPINIDKKINNPDNVSIKLYGNSIQNGTPTPIAPIEIENIGTYDEETGKYKIPFKINETTTYIYLNEPLRKLGDYVDYIDFKNNKVVRNVYAGKLNETNNWAERTSSSYVNCCWFQTDIPKKFFNTLGYSNRFSTIDNGVSDTQHLRYIVGSNYIGVFINKTIVSNLDSFKEWLKSNVIEYHCVLETPIEETIELPDFVLQNSIICIDVDTLIEPSNIMIEYNYEGSILD
jgi:hypothetical protein